MISSFNILINIIDASISVFFVYFALKQKKNRFSILITILLCTICSTICNYYGLLEIALSLSSCIILFIYANYLQPKKIMQNLFLTLGIGVISDISITISILLTSLFFEFPFHDISYIFQFTFAEIIYLFLAIFVSKNLEKYDFLNAKQLRYIFIALLLIDFMYSNLIDDVYCNNSFVIFDIVSFILLNSLSICICLLTYQTQKEQNYIINLQKEYFKLHTQEEIQRINQITATKIEHWKHDLKHNFNTIDYYLDNNQIDKARETINQYREAVNKSQMIVNTGNDLLDYIIVQKYHKINNKNINLIIINDTNDFPLKDNHFSVIVGNLLDNAIENCDSKIKKEIKITIGQEKPYYYIKVENTIIKSTLNTNPNFNTTKKDTNVHGYGLGSVKLLVNKYHGDIHIYEKDNYFIVALIIPI